MGKCRQKMQAMDDTNRKKNRNKYMGKCSENVQSTLLAVCVVVGKWKRENGLTTRQYQDEMQFVLKRTVITYICVGALARNS